MAVHRPLLAMLLFSALSFFTLHSIDQSGAGVLDPELETQLENPPTSPTSTVPTAPSKVLSFLGTEKAVQHMANAMTMAGNNLAIPNEGAWWSDDNGKALEAFVMPGIYEKFQEKADGMAAFLYEMSQYGAILRRKVDNGLSIESDDPQNYKIHNGIMTHTGNITGMRFKQGIKSHSGKLQNVVAHQGAHASFEHAGEAYHIFLSQTIKASEVSIESSENEVILKAEHTVKDIAIITLKYYIRGDTAISKVTVSLRSLVDKLTDVKIIVLKTYNEGIHFEAYCHRYTGFDAECDNTDMKIHSVEGRELSHYSFVQNSALGFAYGVHSEVGPHCMLVKSKRNGSGRLTGSAIIYGTHEVLKDTSFDIKEVVMVTSSGLYTKMPYASLFSHIEERKGLVDYSTSYDYGAELSGMATFALMLHNNLYALPATTQQQKASEVRAWVYQNLQSYAANFLCDQYGDPDRNDVFVRGNALALIAGVKLATISKSTPEFAAIMKSVLLMLDNLLFSQIQKKASPLYGAFPCFSGRLVSSAECHMSAVLALSHVVIVGANLPFGHLSIILHERLLMAAQAIHLMKASLLDSTSSISEVFHKTPTESLLGYKAGLVLRSIYALEHATNDTGFSLDSTAERAVAQLKVTARGILEASAVVYGSGDPTTFVASFKKKATPPESQAWCMMGYFPQYEALAARLLR